MLSPIILAERIYHSDCCDNHPEPSNQRLRVFTDKNGLSAIARPRQGVKLKDGLQKA
jgi:hypothetical protein